MPCGEERGQCHRHAVDKRFEPSGPARHQPPALVELRESVTSPGGTTIRAIRELEQAGVRAAFLNAINAAMERSKELARGDD